MEGGACAGEGGERQGGGEGRLGGGRLRVDLLVQVLDGLLVVSQQRRALQLEGRGEQLVLHGEEVVLQVQRLRDLKASQLHTQGKGGERGCEHRWASATTPPSESKERQRESGDKEGVCAGGR